MSLGIVLVAGVAILMLAMGVFAFMVYRAEVKALEVCIAVLEESLRPKAIEVPKEESDAT